MITDWHPLIIHFPIALISTSVAFECLHFILKRDDLLSASWWTMFFGLISSLAAVASGIIDDSLIGHFGAVWPLWQNHGAMQILTISLFGFVFYILDDFWQSTKHIFCGQRGIFSPKPAA